MLINIIGHADADISLNIHVDAYMEELVLMEIENNCIISIKNIINLFL